MGNTIHLSEFITPVIDRTEEDVNNLRVLLEKGYKYFTEEEKELWLKDHKGALNVSDMNRISNNSYVIGSYLNLPITKVTFTNGQLLRTTDFKTISDNLELIIDTLNSMEFEDEDYKYLVEGIPTIPNLPFNDYIKINLIEEIQLIIYNIIEDIEGV